MEIFNQPCSEFLSFISSALPSNLFYIVRLISALLALNFLSYY